MSATVLLGALATAVSANQLSSSTTHTTTTWSSVEFVEPLGGTVRCPVTVEGSLHGATTTKTVGALMGFVTRASVGSCSGGHATILQATLPWHLRYQGFAGILPDITGTIYNAIGVAFRVEGTFGTCLFLSSATQPIAPRDNLSGTHAVTSVTLSGSITSNENCGPFGERVTGRLQGNSSTNTPQTITLI